MADTRENEETLRRFNDANYVRSAVNSVGITHSLHEYGAKMLRAGFSTDKINSDPALRIFIIALAELSGIDIETNYFLELHNKMTKKRTELMKDPEYAKILG